VTTENEEEVDDWHPSKKGARAGNRTGEYCPKGAFRSSKLKNEITVINRSGRHAFEGSQADGLSSASSAQSASGGIDI